MYHKWQSCDVWLLRHGAQQTDYFVILGYFLLFYFINQKNQNFENMKAISGDIQIHIIILQLHTTNDDHMIYKRKKNRKKAPGGIINLHTCTINGNHMMYGSQDMESNRQNFLSFWVIFCLFTPQTIHKIKFLRK